MEPRLSSMRTLDTSAMKRDFRRTEAYRIFILIRLAEGGTAGRDSTPVSSPAGHFKRAHRRLRKTPVNCPETQRKREIK